MDCQYLIRYLLGKDVLTNSIVFGREMPCTLAGARGLYKLRRETGRNGDLLISLKLFAFREAGSCLVKFEAGSFKIGPEEIEALKRQGAADRADIVRARNAAIKRSKNKFARPPPSEVLFSEALMCGDIGEIRIAPVLVLDFCELYKVWCRRHDLYASPRGRLLRVMARCHQVHVARKRWEHNGEICGPHAFLIPTTWTAGAEIESAALGQSVHAFRLKSLAYRTTPCG